MFGIGTFELILIFGIALIFIGPQKLPQLARSLGKGIREFQKIKDDMIHSVGRTRSPRLPPQKSSPQGISVLSNPIRAYSLIQPFGGVVDEKSLVFRFATLCLVVGGRFRHDSPHRLQSQRGFLLAN